MTKRNSSSAEPIHILLVEDEAAILSALKKQLTNEGFAVDCARELEEAEALIVTTRYAVVIADLRLTWSSAVEGFEILRLVRRSSRATRVVIMTGNVAPEFAYSARLLGADAFFHKPAPLRAITATVHQLLGVA